MFNMIRETKESSIEFAVYIPEPPHRYTLLYHYLRGPKLATYTPSQDGNGTALYFRVVVVVLG
jgi:hypothetical protein